MTDAPITWRETRRRLAADRARIRDALSEPGAEGSFARMLFPAYLCVWLHRWSHYCFARGRRRLARAIWSLNVFLTGADIAPASEIGGGLYIPHPACVTLHCRAGRDLTVMAQSGAGPVYGKSGEVMERLPVLGDSVTLQHHSGVYGAARAGSGVFIAAGCIVSGQIADRCVLTARPLRIRRRDASTPANRQEAN